LISRDGGRALRGIDSGTLITKQNLKTVGPTPMEDAEGLPPQLLGSQVRRRLEILLCDQGPAIDPAKLRGRRLDEIKPGVSVSTLLGRAWTRLNTSVSALSISFGWLSISSLQRSRYTLRFKGGRSVQISARHSD